MRSKTVQRRALPGGAASVADKRFRRSEVRPGRRRRVSRRSWRIAAMVVAAGACAALGVIASSSVVGAEFLAVDQFVVDGNHRLSDGAIDAVIGDVRGTSLLSVDLEGIQSRLLNSPWVASVTVRRVLPSTVALRIHERSPVAIARLENRLYLVDVSGTIIDEFGPQYSDFELPIVDGMAAPPSLDGPVIDPGRAQLATQFLNALDAHSELGQLVSQVDVSRPGNVAVLLSDDPTLLFLGDTQFVERLRTYLEMRQTLLDHLDEVDHVDLRFGETAFVSPRKTGTKRQ